jgi:anti-sigma B factor antagonist
MTLGVNSWIEVSEPGSALILRIGGELDGASRASIEPAVMAAITSSRSVLLDLGELTFCDSAGIAMFVSAGQKASAEGTALSVSNLCRPVRRVFEITRVSDVIDICE